jgi:hypothetical protein
MKWTQIVMSWGKSMKRSGDPVEILHTGNSVGKLELQGGWLVERRPEKSKSWYTNEKRQARRYRDGQSTFCYPVNSHSFNAQIIDASLGGLRIKTDAVLAKNSHVSLILKFGDEIGQFFVKILWQLIGQGSCEYGVLFSKMDQKKNSPLRRYIAHLQSS